MVMFTWFTMTRFCTFCSQLLLMFSHCLDKQSVPSQSPTPMVNGQNGCKSIGPIEFEYVISGPGLRGKMYACLPNISRCTWLSSAEHRSSILQGLTGTLSCRSQSYPSSVHRHCVLIILSCHRQYVKRVIQTTQLV